jgi:thiol-disulfide isomerase/thioredoxin
MTVLTRREILTTSLALIAFTNTKVSAQEVDLGSTALILVGASWCPICKQAAPVLALLAERRGLPVLVATEDARPIPPFPSFVPLEGHPIAGAITNYPTTLVFSSRTQTIVGALEGYRDPAHYVGQLNGLLIKAEAIA